jgi:hypothetical protein
MIATGIQSVEVAISEASLDSRHVVAVRIDNQIRHLIVVGALYRLGIVSVSVMGNEDLSKAGLKIDAIITDRNQPVPGFGRLLLLKDDWFERPFYIAAARPVGSAFRTMGRNGLNPSGLSSRTRRIAAARAITCT